MEHTDNMMLLPLKEYPFITKPMICAHRGDTSSGAVENSLAAIDAALTSGADMIEVDVQMTSDGVLICHHDATLAFADTKPIWLRTYSEITEESYPEVVPKLEDVLRHTAGKIYLNLEMKEYSGFHPSRFVHPLVSMVKDYGMHEYSLYSSFRIDYIQALAWDSNSGIIRPTRKIIDHFNEYALSPVIVDEIDTMTPSEILKFSHATTYACSFSELKKEFVDDIEKHDIFLSIYTARTKEEFTQALSIGARAVVTDIPGELAAYRETLFS